MVYALTNIINGLDNMVSLGQVDSYTVTPQLCSEDKIEINVRPIMAV